MIDLNISMVGYEWGPDDEAQADIYIFTCGCRLSISRKPVVVPIPLGVVELPGFNSRQARCCSPEHRRALGECLFDDFWIIAAVADTLNFTA